MFFVRIRLRCDFIKTYSGFVQLGHIWIFLLHIFDLFVHIIAVLSRTYSYFFAENTAEIVVIIITDQERDRLQFLLFILHQTDRLFHPDSGKTGNDGLSVSLAEHPGKIARIHMIRCSKCRQCDILMVRSQYILTGSALPDFPQNPCCFCPDCFPTGCPAGS